MCVTLQTGKVDLKKALLELPQKRETASFPGKKDFPSSLESCASCPSIYACMGSTHPHAVTALLPSLPRVLTADADESVLLFRSCALKADGAYSMACTYLLRTEQERWLDFLESSHVQMSAELLESSQGSSAQTASLTVPQMLARMSLLFKGVERASQAFLDARRHHALVFRQYLLLEIAINQVSLDPPPAPPPLEDTDNTPKAATAAAADAAAEDAVERLTRLQSLVCDKEIDQHLHDHLRWQRLMQPQKPSMLPRLLFVPLEQHLLQQQLEQPHNQQQQQQEQGYAGGFQQLPFQHAGGRVATADCCTESWFDSVQPALANCTYTPTSASQTRAAARVIWLSTNSLFGC
ncbi:hypothetical protein Esti_003836 [Eimeria stiedai]